jgi:hypothetical protein
VAGSADQGASLLDNIGQVGRDQLPMQTTATTDDSLRGRWIHALPVRISKLRHPPRSAIQRVARRGRDLDRIAHSLSIAGQSFTSSSRILSDTVERRLLALAEGSSVVWLTAEGPFGCCIRCCIG